MSNSDFEKRYIGKIIPVLLKHSLAPDILPSYGLSRHCLGGNALSRKFYSNGQDVLCDAFPKRPEPITKDRLPPLPDMCIGCLDFPYCGGPKPCDTKKRTGIYADRDNARSRIVTFVKAMAGTA